VSHQLEPQFVTYGKKHVKVWAAVNGTWTGTQLSSGKLAVQNATAAAWLMPAGQRAESLLVTGMADGQIYLWKVGGSAGVVLESSLNPV
jgi:microtubule-associated protein-like 6